MDPMDDENTCRICLKKQDAMYSLFRKRNGVSPLEKLKKIGVKIDANNSGPSCVCCDCLAELDITIHFLEKCEKSNQIINEQLTRTLELSEEILHYKDDGDYKNAYYSENRTLDVHQDVNLADVIDEELTNNEPLGLEEARCRECGSKRRCQHWTPPTSHTCPYCQKVFSRKFNFKLHLKRHAGSREWSCPTCGFSVVSRWLAARHCQPRRRLACPVPGCGKTYTTNTNLNTHLRAHSGERPFECNECDKKFTSKNTLTDHMRIHTGALPYICPICGKRFRTNKLSAHMSTHSATQHSCACAGCPHSFPTRRALRRHTATHAAAPAHPATPAPPAHACSKCPARYHHKQSLNKHVRKQHSQKPAIQIEPDALNKDIVCDLS